MSRPRISESERLRREVEARYLGHPRWYCDGWFSRLVIRTIFVLIALSLLWAVLAFGAAAIAGR